MFTALTLSAISVLHAISIAETDKPDSLSEPETDLLLERLASGGLIRLVAGKPRGCCASYCLTRPLEEVSLLKLIDALNEELNSVHFIDSSFYTHYGLAARKLGIINQVTRTCLSEINVSEISVRKK